MVTRTDVDALDSLNLAREHRGGGPGCIVGVVQAGQVVWWRGSGWSGLTPDAAPLDPGSVFYVASVSKQFTAACVALLVADGALALDDAVRYALPELPACFAPIRVRHLIHHLGGVPSVNTLAVQRGLGSAWWERQGQFERRGLWECIDLLATAHTLTFHPGDGYAYSNEGYWLLAGIVERATRQTLGQFAAERLFAPLAMAQSRFRESPDVPQPGLVDGHDVAVSGATQAVTTEFHAVGDGGLLTSLADLARWDDMFSAERPLGDQLVTQMLQRGRLNDGSTVHYAWGLSVREHHGTQIVSHGGNFIGFEAKFVRFPEYGMSVVCLANLAGVDVDGLALATANTLFANRLDFGQPSWRETLPPDGRYPYPPIVPPTCIERRP